MINCSPDCQTANSVHVVCLPFIIYDNEPRLSYIPLANVSGRLYVSDRLSVDLTLVLYGYVSMYVCVCD